MNLLPFVAIFIFVLTMGIQFSFTSYRRVALEKLGMEGAIYVYREAYNKREQKLFLREKPPTPPKENKEKEKPSEPEKKGREEKDYKNHREKFTENSKFCLDLLVQGGHPYLQETLERLLDGLYGNMPIFEGEKKRDEKFIHFFVQEMLQQLKKEKSFTAVTFQDKKWQLVWYKMLKGTFDYKTGWPPLTDYVLINGKKDRKPIIFRKCATPILEAFFGPQMAREIGEKEKEKFVKGAPRSVLSGDELSLVLAGALATERYYLGYHNMPVTVGTQEIKDKTSGVYIIAVFPLEEGEEEGIFPPSLEESL